MQNWLTEIVIKILSLYNAKMMLDCRLETKHFKLTGYSYLANDEISGIVTEQKYVGWVLRVTQRMTDGPIIVELQPGVDREALVLVRNAQYVTWVGFVRLLGLYPVSFTLESIRNKLRNLPREKSTGSEYQLNQSFEKSIAKIELWAEAAWGIPTSSNV